MYERLGLGNLKPTRIVLQLANCYIGVPTEMVDDVLIMVEKFIFLVGFVVLEIKVIIGPNNKC